MLEAVAGLNTDFVMRPTPFCDLSFYFVLFGRLRRLKQRVWWAKDGAGTRAVTGRLGSHIIHPHRVSHGSSRVARGLLPLPESLRDPVRKKLRLTDKC